MDRILDPATTHVLVVALLALLLAGVVRGVRHGARLRRQLAEDPARRGRLYRDSMISAWLVAVLALLAAGASDELAPADLGWAWPDGDGFDYVLSLVLLAVILTGGVRRRRWARSGRPVPSRGAAELILPRTTRERRMAVGVAFTAGITEELVFRGLLIGAGTQVYHLPLAVAALASLALFAAGHAYLGRAGITGAAVAGAVLTAIYLISGSLLLVIVLHVVNDLVALLLVPPSQDRSADTASAKTAA
jgi:membrane protease YdiL (CAAX protease family)